MSALWNKWRSMAGDVRGNALIEFAFVLPLWLLLSTGMLEVGRGFYQTSALEKSVRAGALYLARHSFPLSTTALAAAQNLVKSGNVEGGDYAVSGWAKTGSDLQITSVNFTFDGVDIPVVRIRATVPFDPIFASLPDFVGLTSFTMTAQHEQAHVGD